MPWSVDRPLALVGLALALQSAAQAASAQPSGPGTVTLPPEAGTPAGPAGTSGMGQPRYDAVGLAVLQPVQPGSTGNAVTAAHGQLPPGTVAEITALATGRTILALIDGKTSPVTDKAEIALSPAAARLLDLSGETSAPVRVRTTIASPADLNALRSGQAAARRLDAPPALLAALRLQLSPPQSVASAAPADALPVAATSMRKRPDPTPAPTRPAATPLARPQRGQYLVQVAALSHPTRAQGLARTLGGFVETAGTLHRVRLGPFTDAKSAQRARDAAQRRGYGGATIIVQP